MESGGSGDNVARTSACSATQKCNFSVVVMQLKAQLKTYWNSEFICESDVVMNRRR